ncbi:MAG: hypothetical protein LQ340_007846, partial [Diploschistes diacapsis]
VLHGNNEQTKKHGRKRKRGACEDSEDEVEQKTSPRERVLDQRQTAKMMKHHLEKSRHDNALGIWDDEPFYRYLHLSVARLFAAQLKLDRERLDSGDSVGRSKISLAAKWAPSLEGFHDKHTFIASSIAEILYPRDRFPPEESREMYLKRAREAYRANYLSPLRRHLDVVERKITEQAFAKINYAKVPSLAMDAYKDLFVRKDFAHYERYIEKVAAGKASISGAILTPGSLVKQARVGLGVANLAGAKGLMAQKIAAVMGKTLDGQWNSLVQRMKHNGSLSGTMAVCDVSGSMTHPTFSDRTCPLDHSIGLSLLIAEITEEPFGGCFISFSTVPKVHSVGGPSDKSALSEKVKKIAESNWSMNTNFVAVFEDLILPLAKENRIKQEDMVKQVIVFSDMEFDDAQGNDSWADFRAATADFRVATWESSYERIKRKYKEAGYKMPRLGFWDLAGSHGYDAVAAKPVTKEEGTV